MSAISGNAVVAEEVKPLVKCTDNAVDLVEMMCGICVMGRVFVSILFIDS